MTGEIVPVWDLRHPIQSCVQVYFRLSLWSLAPTAGGLIAPRAASLSRRPPARCARAGHKHPCGSLLFDTPTSRSEARLVSARSRNGELVTRTVADSPVPSLGVLREDRRRPGLI